MGKGRSMSEGWIAVDGKALKNDKALQSWLDVALDFHAQGSGKDTGPAKRRRRAEAGSGQRVPSRISRRADVVTHTESFSRAGAVTPGQLWLGPASPSTLRRYSLRSAMQPRGSCAD